ncbi:MAG: hypothetical protein ACWA5A_01275 [Marinibacterium sp.]
MVQGIRWLVLVTFIGAVSACAQGPREGDFTLVEPEPISVEPVYTGKYK